MRKEGKRKTNYAAAALCFEACAAIFLWVLLIVLKAAGAVEMHWALVLSSIVWIYWLLFAITAMVAGFVYLIAKLKRWYRRQKVDARIVRQAKAAGVWGNPRALGGRALAIHAWEYYGLVRKPGETDKELRRRCFDKAEEEYANQPDWRHLDNG